DAGNTVLVDEPAPPAGGPAAPAVTEPAPGEDLALGTARFVANDGRMPQAVRPLQSPWVMGACRRSAYDARSTALAEGGVYRTFEPYGASRDWLSAGLALGGDGVGLLLWSSPCDAPWLLDAATGRIGRLSPDVTGRDTSLTFTTARASVPSSGAVDVVGTVVQWLLPARGEETSGQPRSAKPRPAQPAKGEPAAPAPAQGASQKPDRSGSNVPSRSAKPRSGG
ncbi:MAG: hypothetical protein JWN79_2876, partial [Gemmatimonadetes bacterium]|nr:hypothetical protein [Gemmatimonadota bacterium]